MSDVKKTRKKTTRKKKTTKKVAKKVKTAVAERERKVDVDALTAEQVDRLSEQIGKEIAKIMDEANISCNKLLGVYGLRTTISYEIVKIEAEEAKS